MKLTLVLLLGLLCTMTLAADICAVKVEDRIDCGYSGVKEDECVNKGCCWRPVQGTDGPQEDGAPWCFHNSLDKFCRDFNFESDTPGFDGSYDLMYKNYVANLNIQDQGGVVASPDPDTPGGSYYWHWMRDAALSMRTYMILNDYEHDSIKHHMEKYMSWVQRAQHDQDPHGQSVLNEPKFILPNGGVYKGPWCRPQTDGPGLRSTTLLEYANVLRNKGQMELVQQKLWKKDGQGILQIDLDYISNNWKENGCDLWEEITSTDFFWNRMAFHQALTLGADFAAKMKDSGRAEHYKKVADEILPTLKAHYNGQFIYESDNRPEDSAVIHALVTCNEGVFDVTGKEAAGTIKTLNRLFCTEYNINQAQDAAGVPGVLYGRYKGDIYAGGNPWQLLTATLAEIFYQVSEKMAVQGNRVLSADEVDHWRDILNLGEKVTAEDLSVAARKAGNSVMYRIWTHVSSDPAILTEQMDRNTGFQMSAKKLTWSFANVLRVLHVHVYNKNQDVIVE